MNNDFFEIAVYEKKGYIYIYPTSLTIDNGYYINYPCTKISNKEDFIKIGNEIILASTRVKNRSEKKENSNNRILNDLAENNWKEFVKNVNSCNVVKNKGDLSGSLQILKPIKKRGGYEYSNKRSVYVSSSNYQEIGGNIIDALS